MRASDADAVGKAGEAWSWRLGEALQAQAGLHRRQGAWFASRQPAPCSRLRAARRGAVHGVAAAAASDTGSHTGRTARPQTNHQDGALA